MKFPPREYETKRLIFRARSANQAEELFKLIDKNREHLNPWMPWVEGTRSSENTHQYIEMISKKWDEGKTFDFTMYDKTSEKIIGSFGLHTINWEKRECYLGYWIDKDFQGKGLISEAIKNCEIWAQELGFERMYLTCDSLNIRSRNTAVRNGYKLELQYLDVNKRDTLKFVKLL